MKGLKKMGKTEKKLDFNTVFVFILLIIGVGCFIFNNSVDVTSLILAIVLFAAGFFFLIKGGDWFVDGATSIAEKFKIPEILIGATIVSIGTTLPEVMVSAQAAAKGAGSISYGNAIGSIICNVSLIAAITLAVKPGKVNRKPLLVPVIFFFGSAAIYAFTAYCLGRFSRAIGIVLLIIFVVYMVINVINAKKGNAEPAEDEEESKEVMPVWKALIFLVFGAAIIAFGATLLVDNGTIIATKVGIPESVIALTFVALGTSLPELVTAITSLAKGHGALSLGNVIGANIFNIILVSGLSITIKPFDVPSEKLIAGMNASLIIDIPLMIIVMLILTVPALVKQKLYRWQGILLLLIYAAFCVFQFVG